MYCLCHCLQVVWVQTFYKRMVIRVVHKRNEFKTAIGFFDYPYHTSGIKPSLVRITADLSVTNCKNFLSPQLTAADGVTGRKFPGRRDGRERGGNVAG